MTVEELIDLLSDLPSDLEVILASDAEGNDLSPCDESFTVGVFEDGELTDTDGDVEDANAVVLWPQ